MKKINSLLLFHNKRLQHFIIFFLSMNVLFINIMAFVEIMNYLCLGKNKIDILENEV